MDREYHDYIEILPVALLDQNRKTVEALKALADSLGIGLGWHYLLDLSWILSHMDAWANLTILDAGAGTGLLQWYLAEQEAEVISVDRVNRAELPFRFRSRYRVRGLRPEDLASSSRLIAQNVSSAPTAAGRIKRLARSLGGAAATGLSPKPTGQVTIYNQDLTALVDIPDESVDVVVSVSALEHNPPEAMESVVQELMRVLKKGGLLLATLGAARDEDWYHVPSAGWCYTDATLRRVFSLEAGAASNYAEYDRLFGALAGCAELRDHLADFYFKSGDNGMPWGKWDPAYQSVGVCKVKRNNR
ncbi:MAG: class I SAM-dependent methyltransferase [Chloroflexi bacterium]|nr:class I SAM-dependent methyltransferase [Chloroflexota bacterium]